MCIHEVMADLMGRMMNDYLIHTPLFCAGIAIRGIQDPPNDVGPDEPYSSPHSGSHQEHPHACLMPSKDVPFEELTLPLLFCCYLKSCRRVSGSS